MKLKTGVSHTDHGLTAEQLQYVLDLYRDLSEFAIKSFFLPSELGSLPCGLYGPAMGDAPVTEDEVRYQVREGRKNASRILIGADSRRMQQGTLICGPSGDEPCVLYTVYGGPAAPREPGDLTCPIGDIEAARKFWAVHALAP